MRQAVAGCVKIEGVVSYYVNTVPEGEAHGYEAFRRIRLELSLQRRAEIMTLREQILHFVSKEQQLLDVIRSIDVELY